MFFIYVLPSYLVFEITKYEVGNDERFYDRQGLDHMGLYMPYSEAQTLFPMHRGDS